MGVRGAMRFWTPMSVLLGRNERARFYRLSLEQDDAPTPRFGIRSSALWTVDRNDGRRHTSPAVCRRCRRTALRLAEFSDEDFDAGCPSSRLRRHLHKPLFFFYFSIVLLKRFVLLAPFIPRFTLSTSCLTFVPCQCLLPALSSLVPA
jgi:hypothetical protein